MLLGDMFQKVGIRVHYSEIDNDDTIAAYAHAHGAALMSDDKDFFRYRDHKYQVFSNFEVRQGKLHLKRKDFIPHGSSRDLILDPLPITYEQHPSIYRIKKNKECFKGNPSPLTKIYGNLH